MSNIKTQKNLLNEETITQPHCIRVILETLKGKHDRKSAKRILWFLSAHARWLQRLVLNDTFVPSEYTEETRIEYGKERHLQKPRFRKD